MSLYSLWLENNGAQTRYPPHSSEHVNYYTTDAVKFFSHTLLIYCVSATFSNFSAISWRPVLVVEEAGVPGENHRPLASNW